MKALVLLHLKMAVIQNKREKLVTDKAFILQRICIYAGKQIDPNSDFQVKDVLSSELGIKLPQKQTLDDSLAATNSDHEIVGLIIKYRNIG